MGYMHQKRYLKKPNYLTVPAAIRELEKIEMTRQLDKVYRLDHAVTKTQQVILDAFNIESSHVKYKANYISEISVDAIVATDIERKKSRTAAST